MHCNNAYEDEKNVQSLVPPIERDILVMRSDLVAVELPDFGVGVQFLAESFAPEVISPRDYAYEYRI